MATDIELRSGHRMPMLGLGLSHNGGYSDAAIRKAISIGIRKFDTAQRYGSEDGLGRIIKQSAIPREEFFITTKVWPGNYDRIRDSVDESLKALQSTYIDLLLVHWPAHHEDATGRAKVWNVFEKLYEEGVCKSIGVSNFLPDHLTDLCSACKVVPHVNQCEYNPLQQNQQVVKTCKRFKVVLEGYCPLAKGAALVDSTVMMVAQQKSKTPAQVCIRWCLQKGVPTIPKSVKPERVVENANVFDFELTPEEMKSLDDLHCDLHVTWNPEGIP
eukprot:m.86443 g.86443  ORF g.86443 m.86443 type:complete len:272 (+) comp25972_c1_seq1:48-863(+)